MVVFPRLSASFRIVHNFFLLIVPNAFNRAGMAGWVTLNDSASSTFLGFKVKIALFGSIETSTQMFVAMEQAAQPSIAFMFFYSN